MLRGSWRRGPVIVVCTLLLGACTASAAQEASQSAPASPSAAPASAWPGTYSDGVEGQWTVELTRGEIFERAREQKISTKCVRDFLDPIKFKRTLTWDLYLRDGHWALLGARDGGKSVPFDGGTYGMPYKELEWALFTSQAPGVRDDVWLVPWIDGDSLKMDLLDLTQWTDATSKWPVADDPYCFVQAASVVELTNPFERVT